MKKISTVVYGVLGLITFVACSTSAFKYHPQSKSKSEILRSTPNVVASTKIKQTEPSLREKMGRFRKILLRGGPKTQSDWELHDELLNSYTQLKLTDGSLPNQINVAANSKVAFNFPSYCLDPTRSGPSQNERFSWKKGDTGIPYYKELLEYAVKHNVKQSLIQELFWNLQNKTRWEEYPDQLKLILQTIDPQVYDKLPSRSKTRLKKAATNLLSDYVPGVQSARDAVSLVEGKYYSFDEIRRNLENRKSSEPLKSDSDTLEGIPDTSLYVETKSSGFSNQAVTLYNPTDNPILLNLTDYYLESTRGDVQRIGLTHPVVNLDLLNELEELLYSGMLRAGIGFTPGLNDVADAYELLVGKDFITGASLSLQERTLSGAGLIVGSGVGYRFAKRAAEAPASFVRNFEEGLEQASRKSIKVEQAEAKTFLKESELSLAKRRRASKIRSYTAEEANLGHVHQKNPPYKIGTRVVEFKSVEGDKWVRVHGLNNQQGDWLMRKEAIDGLSAREIQKKYSIEKVPTHISDVNPTPGTKMRRGRVADNFSGHEGAIQYEILDEPMESWFSNTRPVHGK